MLTVQVGSSKLVVLTVGAYHFSSDTGVDTFRIGWITGHNAFEGFIEAKITANGVKIIITNRKCYP